MTTLRTLAERDWPQDYKGLVFLGRAAQEVGTAMFGPDWTGDEIHTAAHPPLPATVEGALDEHRVHWLLYTHRPDRALPRPTAQAITRAPVPPPSLASLSFGASRHQASEVSPPLFKPSALDIAEARHVIDELNDQAGPALTRKQYVLKEIARAAEAGELHVVYVEDATGRESPCPSNWWRGSNVEARLSVWHIDPKSPREKAAYYSNTSAPLYVERETLAAFIRVKPYNKLHMGLLQREAEAASLAGRLAQDSQWDLTTTLLWIGLRGTAPIARILAHWPDHAGYGSGEAVAFAGAYLSEPPDDETVLSTRPDQELLSALRDGRLTASGQRRGIEERSAIEALAWLDLQLANGPSLHKGQGACAWGAGLVHGLQSYPGVYWTRLLFPRQGVMTAFPQSGHAVPAQTAVPQPQPWALLPGMKAVQWLQNPATLCEANRRLTAGETRKQRLNGVLFEMALEVGLRTTQASISDLRRQYKIGPPYDGA